MLENRSQEEDLAWGILGLIALERDLGPQAKQAVAGIQRLLQDPNPEVRLAAGEALWKVDRQAQAVLPVFVEGLKNQKSWALRGGSIAALGQMGPEAKTAVPDLIEMLKDQYEDIRQLAVDALAQIGPDAKAAVPALRALSNDPDSQVRQKSAQALQRIQGEGAAETVQR